jgi:hypothetical protein
VGRIANKIGIALEIGLALAAGVAPAFETGTILDAKLQADGRGGFPCTLRGVVTMPAGSGEFYLQDNSSGVKVLSTSYDLKEGERLEVEGWMYLADSSEFQVRARSVLSLGEGEPPRARLITLPAAFAGAYQGQLVSVQGSVLEVDFGADYDVVSICAERSSLRVFYPANRHGISVFEKVFPGMQVAVTGISVPQTADPEFDGYQVRVRRPSDLAIRPSLKESRASPSAWAGTVAAMLLVVAAAWMWRRAQPGSQVQ